MKHDSEPSLIQRLENKRYSLAALILILYLIPILLLTGYRMRLMPAQGSWSLFTIGLLSGISGTAILCVLLIRWENWIITLTTKTPEQDKAAAAILEELKLAHEKAQSVLQEELTAKMEEFQKLHALIHDLEDTKNIHLQNEENYQKTIREQQGDIEQQKQQIELLENKEKELQYEINTLLQVSHLDEESSYPFPDLDLDGMPANDTPPIDALFSDPHLKRCIEIATKMTGAQHLSNVPSRFLELSSDSNALELRRLSDSLRAESPHIVILYSPNDNKLLFTNNAVKTLLGWTSDKFVLSFQELIQDSLDDWQRGLKGLETANEVLIPLSIKTKSGPNAHFNCLLGKIPTGLFQHYAIGVIKDKTNSPQSHRDH